MICAFCFSCEQRLRAFIQPSPKKNAGRKAREKVCKLTWDCFLSDYEFGHWPFEWRRSAMDVPIRRLLATRDVLASSGCCRMIPPASLTESKYCWRNRIYRTLCRRFSWPQAVRDSVAERTPWRRMCSLEWTPPCCAEGETARCPPLVPGWRRIPPKGGCLPRIPIR